MRRQRRAALTGQARDNSLTPKGRPFRTAEAIDQMSTIIRNSSAAPVIAAPPS